MSNYSDAANAGENGFFGQGLGLRSVVSDVFGHFGAGVTLGTNFLLVVLDSAGRPVDAGLSYAISYFNPATGQQVTLPLIHNPGLPYQSNLPENQPVDFILTPGSRYLIARNYSVTIGPSAFSVLRVQLDYPAGTVYARITKKRLL